MTLEGSLNNYNTMQQILLNRLQSKKKKKKILYSAIRQRRIKLLEHIHNGKSLNIFFEKGYKLHHLCK